VRAFLEAGAFVQAIEALHDLAEHFIKRAQPEKALLCLKKAETLDAYHERPTLQWKTQQQMALTLWELGHPKDAVQRLKVVLQHAEAHEDAYWQASTLFLIGELAFDSLNGVEWALNCMEKALAFGETVLGSERYRAFRQRKRQVEEELTHEHPHTSEPHPLKHTPNSPQSVGWKRRTPRKLPY
jgi:tetratricopeptide (TPR) repeat protein